MNDWLDQLESHLAPYATRSSQTAGRKQPEPLHPYRAPFQRDRDRIVHSSAFRRLANKTQVFTGAWGDYHRSRLTHTLEVASVARSLCRALRVNEDLTEALALLHDIGHPPFGHTGEDVLDECLKAHGGFDHNSQALRIVELLERRYPSMCGLNLSLETLAGQEYRRDKKQAVKAPGAVEHSGHVEFFGPVERGASPQAIGCSPSLEVQVVDGADSVTYNTHDLDDALKLGLLTMEDLAGQALWSEAERRVATRFAGLSEDEKRRAVLHELLDWQVGDLVSQTQKAIAEHGVTNAEGVLRAPWLVHQNPAIAEPKREIEQFLFERVYRHPLVAERRTMAQEHLREMFDRLVKAPHQIPPRFRPLAGEDPPERQVADYLGGMTDRFAWRVGRRINRLQA